MSLPVVGSLSGDDEVACIACGERLDRADVREYDKHGDRFDREGKSFEYLCKPCHRACCHQPRDGLEATLVAAGAGDADRSTFLRQFDAQAREDAAPAGE